jgi:hypothetical protein
MDLDEARTLLGVSPTDEWDAVRAAYRRLIRQQHPDHAGSGATERAAQLNEAYRVLAQALQTQTLANARLRPPVEPPPPRFDAHVEGADVLIVEATPDEAFSQLLEAGHVVGHVSYVDRSSGIFEVVVKYEGETCSFVVSLEGDEKTEAYCTLESMERSQRLSPTPIVRRLAAALRDPWINPPAGSGPLVGPDPYVGVYVDSDDSETLQTVATCVERLAAVLGYERSTQVR